MKVIGITGPTGAGKTTALNALRELGGRVVDCDAVYHELLRSSGPMLEQLRERFGDGVFSAHGALDRKALGAVVFADKKALDDLNAITHEYVKQEVARAIRQAEAEGVRAVAIDAIALIESGIAALCDCTVAVTAPEEVRVKRIMEREGIPEEYARLRAGAQKEEDWFRANCTYVLHNDCTDAGQFQAKARALFEAIISKQEEN